MKKGYKDCLYTDEDAENFNRIKEEMEKSKSIEELKIAFKKAIPKIITLNEVMRSLLINTKEWLKSHFMNKNKTK